jgi:hypothetical protein
MMRPLRALVAFVALAAATVAPSGIAHAASSTAVVVIDTGASVRSAIIHFDGTITGIQALELAGANPGTYGFQGQGAAVCSLDGVGNPADQSCLVGPNSEYWAYHVARGGTSSWTYSRGCACTTMVGDGDVEGWRYGTGAAPRASASFCSYVACPAPEPPPSGGDGGAAAPDGGGGSGSGGGGSSAAPPGGAPPAVGTPAPDGGAPAATGSAGGTSGGVPDTANATDVRGPAAVPGASGGGPTVVPDGRRVDEGNGSAKGGSAADGAAGDDQGSDGTSAPTTTGPRAASDPAGGAKGDGELGAVAASQRGPAGEDDDGSPVGIAIAAGVLAVAAAGAVILRRRRIRSNTG